MNQPLYNLTNQYLGLMDLSEDLPEDALNDTLEAIEGDIQDKATNIIAVIANLNTDALDAEIKRMQNMKRVITNRQTALKDYLRENMQRMDMKKITWPTGSVTLRKPLPIVVVDDADALPEKFNKVTVAPNKVLIKATLKAGEVVPGAHLEDGKPGILIK